MSNDTITTRASVSRSVPPDFATVELNAFGSGPTPTVARASARSLASEIDESLSEIDTEGVRTVEISINEADEMFGPPNPSDAPFQARERLEVDCRPESVDDIVLEATDTGGTVPNISYDVHDEVRRSLEEDALAGAMERARERATIIASAADSSIERIRAVKTTDVAVGTEGIVDSALDEGFESDAHPSPITVSEEVEVEFQLVDQ